VHLAKLTGATLAVAKLDRLSRNDAFLLTLRDSGVRFSAVNLPEANDLTVGIMAVVAQREREAISKRCALRRAPASGCGREWDAEQSSSRQQSNHRPCVVDRVHKSCPLDHWLKYCLGSGINRCFATREKDIQRNSHELRGFDVSRL
jgi:hypothetical protein